MTHAPDLHLIYLTGDEGFVRILDGDPWEKAKAGEISLANRLSTMTIMGLNRYVYYWSYNERPANPKN